MPSGGARKAGPGKRMGRPNVKPLPKVRRDVAYEILEIVNGQRTRLQCSGEALEWMKVYDVADNRLKWDMLRYVKECVDGKPKQRVDPMAFDPNAPLRVIVEHIGRRPQI